MPDESHDEDRAAILARRQRFIALAIGGLTTSCGPGAASDGGTTTVASTAGSSTEAETEAETETETELDTSTTVDFVPTGPQPCLRPEQCSSFDQDCPEGEKCVAYGSTGDNWDANKCVSVLGDKPAGESCTYGGTLEASDDCDESSYCWDVQDIDGVLTGVCTPFCEGSASSWTCAEGTTCLIANEGSLVLCVAECDPLMQDCGEGFGCSWTGDDFACLLTTTGQGVGDPCGFVNDCVAGNICMGSAASPICNGASCCVEYCAVDDPMSCPDPQAECASFFLEGQAPAGLETLGVCIVPAACDGNSDCAPAVTVDSGLL